MSSVDVWLLGLSAVGSNHLVLVMISFDYIRRFVSLAYLFLSLILIFQKASFFFQLTKKALILQFQSI